jgi:predicted enzyme related to lactoylglutathione lyase
VRFEQEPEESPYGAYAQVRDPDGNVFGLLQQASG